MPWHTQAKAREQLYSYMHPVKLKKIKAWTLSVEKVKFILPYWICKYYFLHVLKLEHMAGEKTIGSVQESCSKTKVILTNTKE